jgi:hypothetical protein
MMFCVITNIYNKETKGPTLMELFTATGMLRHRSAVKNIDAPMLMRVWQELEYHINVCCVTRGTHIEHL